jgi:hypothetical protein
MAGVNVVCIAAAGSAVVWRLLAAEERAAVAARSEPRSRVRPFHGQAKAGCLRP